ncbi:MAG: phosphotransferase [Candidatus Liptonbacteria bacterium]|nr:phosphotransferase [Candidatus Liptonbacteria bacterium]
MEKIELKKLSEVISKRLGRAIIFSSAEVMKGGFQSHAFKLTTQDGERFFLKKMKQSGEAGFEITERHLFSYAVSHSMTKRSGLAPEPLGVIIGHEAEMIVLPNLDEGVSLYHVQKFADDLGESYWSLLLSKKTKKVPDENDRKEIEAIINLLVRIHSGPLPKFSLTVLKTLYNDSLQSLLAYPGYFFLFLSDFGSKHPLLPRSKHGAYIGLILNLVYRWENNTKRLRPLHGDFWGANIFLLSNDKATAIDFSRIPFGEPGIDVGYFVAQYLWFYHSTGNPYFKKLGELFIESYATKASDKDIRKALCLPLGLLALLYCNPRFHPDNNSASEKSFFKVVLANLKSGEFSWGKKK